MPNQTIPITLTWGPTDASFSAANINELGTKIAAQLSAAIRADVSFILQLLNDPTTYQTGLIFNLTQGVLKYWNSASGRYIPVTPFQIGDLKNSFVGVDTLSIGWVILNGRAITAIPGLSFAQQTVLESFFGVGGSLPIVTPQNISNLPASNAFSGISPVTVLPADGDIASLDPADLRSGMEILRDSVAAIEVQLNANQDKSDELLAAISAVTTPPLYALMFIGFA